ncbi:acyltransferase [Aureitalea sp. L0-47]|uniref:acyltransferase family protein n=1 Tax=Aureitalea sp. L0-47 TaxID=2816962 RepID=UPI002238084B|nr:acyltransferase [Aureitalea sp. L0-47]MCW5519186.1 acyltransferase [Aureitalea sp. L0-47]
MKKFNFHFFPHDQKQDHFKALDGLRGIAVLFVLLSHSSNANLFFHEYINLQKIGKVGVYLFFVLSAYLLDRQIALVFRNKQSSQLYWKNYFLRRFLRIYPMFVLALALYGLLNYTGVNTVIDEWMDIPLHMLLVKGESIFWSIPVEFKYYFISPIIIWFCHKFLKWNKLLLLLFFVIIIGATLGLELRYNYPDTSTTRFFPIFIVGTMLSIYELLFGDKLNRKIEPYVMNILGILAFAGILITIPYFFTQLFGFELYFHSAKLFVPYATAWGLILLAAKYGKGIVKTILEFKFLRYIGAISFSMYLFHMPILNIVVDSGAPKGTKIYLFFLITIIFSSCSYLLVERPLSKIRIRQRNKATN